MWESVVCACTVMYGCRMGTLGFTLYIINSNATQPGSQASQTYVFISTTILLLLANH